MIAKRKGGEEIRRPAHEQTPRNSQVELPPGRRASEQAAIVQRFNTGS